MYCMSNFQTSFRSVLVSPTSWGIYLATPCFTVITSNFLTQSVCCLMLDMYCTVSLSEFPHWNQLQQKTRQLSDWTRAYTVPDGQTGLKQKKTLFFGQVRSHQLTCNTCIYLSMPSSKQYKSAKKVNRQAANSIGNYMWILLKISHVLRWEVSVIEVMVNGGVPAD